MTQVSVGTGLLIDMCASAVVLAPLVVGVLVLVPLGVVFLACRFPFLAW